tara:strand:- start:55 stop:303 length:249 start_codon:yes stop_codon:yes gene_type:complete
VNPKNPIAQQREAFYSSIKVLLDDDAREDAKKNRGRRRGDKSLFFFFYSISALVMVVLGFAVTMIPDSRERERELDSKNSSF